MNVICSINRSVLFLLVGAIAIAALPVLRAETPAEQVKMCGGIPLTTDLLDKMDAFVKSMNSDAAAKAELAEIGKDPTVGTTPESWVTAINSKCPKSAANLKSAGISVDDFAKGMFALMGCSMSEDLAKSEDATVKANFEFVKANNSRATQTFSSFMQLSMPPDAK
jgi:hypothetical protein